MTALAHRQASEGGFALVETLITTAIIAAMLGVSYEVITTTSRARTALQEERRAALFAQSLLARVGTDIALAPGETEGRTDDLQWRIAIDRYRGDDMGGGAGGGATFLRPMQVDVSVGSAERGKPLITLQSLRVAS